MNNNKIKNNITNLLIFIIITLGILIMLNTTGLSVLFIIGILSVYISFYLINPLLYEIGHIILAKIYGWKISKVIVCNIILYEKEKLTFKYNKNQQKRILSMTYMYQPTKEHKYKLVLMGGIIIHFFILVVSILLYIFSYNIYLKIIAFAFIISTLLSITINIIPQKIFETETDMLKLINKKQCYKNDTIEEEIQLTKVLVELQDKDILQIEDKEFLLKKKITNNYIMLLHYIYANKLKGKKKIKYLEELLKYKNTNLNENIIITEIIINKIIYDYNKKEVDKLYKNKSYQQYINDDNINFEVLVAKYCYNKINGKTKEANKIFNKLNLIALTTKDEATQAAEMKLLDEIKKIK